MRRTSILISATLLQCTHYPPPNYIALALLAPSKLSVSVSISKLNGASGLVIRNAASGETISGVTANGVQTFQQTVSLGGRYDIQIASQPSGKTCTAANATGTAYGPVTVSVTCPANAYDIFITAATVAPNVGLSGMDAICNADSLRTTSNIYKAMLGASGRRACSTPNCSGGAAEHTGWVLESNTSYYRPGTSTLIGTTNAAGIFSFNLVNAWQGGSHPWTGLNADWTSSSSNCLDWTSLSAGQTGTEGAAPDNTTGALDAFGPLACSNTWPGIICVAQ